MLRINLVPEETIKNTLWWTLPCIIGTVVALIFIIIVRLYLDSLLLQTSLLTSQKNELDVQIASLKEKNKEFDPIDLELKKLSTKIEALQQITSSKLSTYKPLIILELLQKLKPEEIWFRNVTIEKVTIPTVTAEENTPGLTDRPPRKDPNAPPPSTPHDPRIILSGSSTDPEAISKFIDQLERTRDNMVTDSDLRTKIYFKDLKLSKLSSSQVEKKEITHFDLTFDYEEKTEQNTQPATKDI